ncbi:hypothetical protein [Prauserella aidingensis]|uniref:hypothetical protein n=1 Tax=Prauserella aidingensis TaxID=387890 RepID=UPI0020A24167|nr:hypothetical protein [Prauserella aidingensis]
MHDERLVVDLVPGPRARHHSDGTGRVGRCSTGPDEVSAHGDSQTLRGELVEVDAEGLLVVAENPRSKLPMVSADGSALKAIDSWTVSAVNQPFGGTAHRHDLP